MKLTSLVLIGALVACGYAQAQAQPAMPKPTTGTSSGADPQEVARACKSEAKALCPGKTGQDAVSCLQSKSDKLSPRCKDSVSK
jgi:hypothetical protein